MLSKLFGSATTKGTELKAKTAAGAREEWAKREPLIRAEIAKRQAELKPKVQAAYVAMDEQAQKVLKHPAAEYIKQNPQIVTAAIIPVLIAIGFPGAATLSSAVKAFGIVEMILPLMALLTLGSEMVSDMPQ